MSEHCKKGVALHHLGRYVEAEREFLQAIEENSSDPEPRSNLVLPLLAQNKITRAVEAGRTAVAMAPDVSQTHYVLSEALLAARQYKQAETSIQESLRLDPKKSECHGLNSILPCGKIIRQRHWSAHKPGWLWIRTACTA